MLFRNGLKAAALSVALFALPVAPALAETIIVKASGPSARTFPPGRKLADNSSITLRAGDLLILLDGRGTRTLRGPGTFGTSATAVAARDTRTTLASLLEGKRVRRARTGAVRGVGGDEGPVRSPNLWYVDVSQSSTVCVPDPANIQLWRPDTMEAINVTATSKANGKSATFAFPAGTSTVSFPTAQLPVMDGSVYSLTWPGLAAPVEIGFSVMETKAEGLESTVSMLITRKCEAQLNLVVETVALPDPASDTPAG